MIMGALSLRGGRRALRVLASLSLAAAASAQLHAWEALPVPGRAIVTAFTAGPAGMLVGTDRGRIYLSGDAGGNWSLAWNGQKRELAAGIRGFLVGDSVILAASGILINFGTWDCWSSQCGNPGAAGGILRSRDGGRTWSLAGPPGVTALARLRESSILAATLSGFHRSEDWGATWKAVTVVPAQGNMWTQDRIRSFAVSGLAAVRGDAYALMYNDGLHRLYLPSAGDTAYRIEKSLPNATLVAQGGDTLLARVPGAVLSGWLPGRSGVAWDTVYRANLEGIAAAPGGWIGIASRMPGNNRFQGPLLRSADGGRTWRTAAPGESSGTGFFEYQGKWFWSVFGGGLKRFASGDPGWTDANAGFQDGTISGVAVAGGSILAVSGIAGYAQGLFHRGPGTPASWAFVQELGGAPALAARGGRFFLLDNGSLSASPGGAPGSWTMVSPVEASGSLVAGDGWQTVIRRDNSRLVCASGNCEIAPTGTLPFPSSTVMYPTMVANDFTSAAVDGDTLYLSLDSLYRSEDRGRSFGPAIPVSVYSLVLHAGRLHALYPRIFEDSGAGWRTLPGLGVSSDGGRTWSVDDSVGIPGNPWSTRLLAERPGELFCSADSAVFSRKDGETRWTGLNREPLPARIASLAVQGDQLAVTLDDGTAWVLALEPSPVEVRRRAAGRSRVAEAGANLFRAPGSTGSDWRRLDGRAVPSTQPISAGRRDTRR